MTPKYYLKTKKCNRRGTRKWKKCRYIKSKLQKKWWSHVDPIAIVMQCIVWPNWCFCLEISPSMLVTACLSGQKLPKKIRQILGRTFSKTKFIIHFVQGTALHCIHHAQHINQCGTFYHFFIIFLLDSNYSNNLCVVTTKYFDNFWKCNISQQSLNLTDFPFCVSAAPA